MIRAPLLCAGPWRSYVEGQFANMPPRTDSSTGAHQHFESLASRPPRTRRIACDLWRYVRLPVELTRGSEVIVHVFADFCGFVPVWSCAIKVRRGASLDNFAKADSGGDGLPNHDASYNVDQADAAS